MEFLFKSCEDFDEEIFLKFAETRRALCPGCGLVSRSRHARGKVRKVYHGFGFGRKVYLLLRKNRYFCRRCGKPFMERFPLILPQQRRTIEAEEQTLEGLRGQSFKSLAEKEGISYDVARRVLQQRAFFVSTMTRVKNRKGY